MHPQRAGGRKLGQQSPSEVGAPPRPQLAGSHLGRHNRLYIHYGVSLTYAPGRRWCITRPGGQCNSVPHRVCVMRALTSGLSCAAALLLAACCAAQRPGERKALCHGLRLLRTVHLQTSTVTRKQLLTQPRDRQVRGQQGKHVPDTGIQVLSEQHGGRLMLLIRLISEAHN